LEKNLVSGTELNGAWLWIDRKSERQEAFQARSSGWVARFVTMAAFSISICGREYHHFLTGGVGSELNGRESRSTRKSKLSLFLQ
jgi:hypothetical protein